jgi:RNA polymerase sigma-70 factor (ECF subfamily)
MRQGLMGMGGARVPNELAPNGEQWRPAKRENSHKMARVDRSAEAVTTLRAHEQALATLITQLAEGDQGALALLYDQTSSLVYSLALRILNDPPAAEDVTIEVYTQVYRQASSYDPKRGSPTAWLLTLARSRAIDRLRAESHHREREEPLEGAQVLAALTTNPEEQSSASELRQIVQRALATLTYEQREVIESAYYMGLSHGEIAARLGQPLGTVKTRMRTGMMLLRERLRPLLTEAHS